MSRARCCWSSAKPSLLDVRAANLDDVCADLQAAYVDTGKIPGLSIHVGHKGKEIYSNAFGVRNVETKEPWTTETMHQIQSMTKSIVSAALMTLVEDGKLALDDPVSKFIPGFGETVLTGGSVESPTTTPATKPATLRHCLTHTAGTPYCFLLTEDPLLAVGDKLAFTASPETLGILPAGVAEVAEKFGKLPLANQPGQKFRYGVGIDVIAHVIAVCTGQAVDTYIKEKIFEPLGMSCQGWNIPEGPLMADVAVGYQGVKGGGFTVLEENLQAFDPTAAAVAGRELAGVAGQTGGGGLLMHSKDFFKFALMLANHGTGTNGAAILRPESVRTMMSNQLEGGASLADPAINTHLTDIAAGTGCAVAGCMPGGCGFGIGGSVILDKQAAGEKAGPCSEGTFGWLGYSFTEYWVDPAKELTVSFHSQVLWGPVLGMGYTGADGKYLEEFRSVVAGKVYAAMGL
jgi:CubicO group peptidase (beta-lactamase class C family)